MPPAGSHAALDGTNAIQREIALRAARLCAPGYGQDPGEAAPKPGPGSTLPGTNPHDEPATGLRPGGEPEAPPRLTLPGANPMTREPETAPTLTRLTSTKTAALCSTT